jgi:UDP-glucose 4-epimerase
VPEGADFVHGDVRDRPTVLQVLEGADIVFHEAARVSIRASMDRFHDDAAVNVMGTLALLDAVAKRPVERIVFASSMGVYADAPGTRPVPEHHPQEPISPYGIGKLAAEKYCMVVARELGIRAAALRYFNTYGPGQAFTPYVGVITIFITKLLAGEPPTVFGDGRQTRDFVSVHDIVAANLLAADYSGDERIFNIGSGEGRDVLSIATLLRDRIAPDLEICHAEAHAGEIRNSVADIRRAQRELGYVPRGRFEDEIEGLIALHRASRGHRKH